jgi:hypothetical protein
VRSLDDILDLLNRYHQRATYGAVGGIINRHPKFVMQDRPRNHLHSWVVNQDTGLPTRYSEDEMHPALLERTAILTSDTDLNFWLKNPQ